MTIVRLALTDVDEVLDDEPGTPLGDRGDWPLLVALAATRPELTGRLADLFWTALNTTRSRDVAFDALETLLRSAFRKDGRPWTREGLAALLLPDRRGARPAAAGLAAAPNDEGSGPAAPRGAGPRPVEARRARGAAAVRRGGEP